MKKIYTTLLFVLLSGCCSYNTADFIGGFPQKPELKPVRNGNDLIENIAKMKFYIDKTEEIKEKKKNIL